MKKPPFQQLKGTPAQKVRHRICFGFTLATLAVSLLLGAGLFHFNPRPKRNFNQQNYRDILRQMGYISTLEREVSKAKEDADDKIVS